MKRIGLALAACLGLAATAVPASADVTYTLNNGGSILPTPGSYGTVNVTQTAANILEVKIDLLSTERFVSTGSGTNGHAGINWSLTGSPTISDIQVVSSNSTKFTVSTFNPTGSYQNSPFGPFEYAITYNGNGAGNATETSITFDITFGSNIVLSPSIFETVSGVVFAADIGTGCSSSVNGHGETKTSCANTGAVATGPGTQVPEPGTMSLSVAGLMGLMGFAMFQRRRKAVRAN